MMLLRQVGITERRTTLPPRNFGGAVFRDSVLIDKVPPLVPLFEKPIFVGIYALRDHYRACDYIVGEPGRVDRP